MLTWDERGAARGGGCSAVRLLAQTLPMLFVILRGSHRLFRNHCRLEDPFAEGESDTVNVREEFGDLIRKLSSREEQAW